jgi:hypothetical protein
MLCDSLRPLHLVGYPNRLFELLTSFENGNHFSSEKEVDKSSPVKIDWRVPGAAESLADDPAELRMRSFCILNLHKQSSSRSRDPLKLLWFYLKQLTEPRDGYPLSSSLQEGEKP